MAEAVDTDSVDGTRMRPLRAALLYSLSAILCPILVPCPTLGQDVAVKSPSTSPATDASKADPAVLVENQNQAIQEGITAFRAENFRAAAQSFETAAAIKSVSSAHAYAWLSRTYLHLHRVPEAEEAAMKATESDKTLANAQVAMAEVYFREGKLPPAEALLIDLVKKQNTTARTYLVLANIHRATANYKSARALIELAHKSDPKDPDIRESWLRSMTREERLEEWKRRLTEGNFENEEERLRIAAALAISEDRKKNANRSCKLVNKLAATEVKLERTMLDPTRYSSYQMAVKVNGVKAMLELDTGAGGILVSSKVAEKAGLNKLTADPISGFGDTGAAQGYIAFADKLQIGELEFENCYIEVVDKKRALGVDGLIGADVFASYLVDIDFPDQRLKLSQLPPYPDQAAQQPGLESESEPEPGAGLHDRWIPPEYKDYEKVYRFGHMLLLPVQLNKTPYKLFLLDTGSWDNTLSPAAAREASKIHEDADIKVKGLSGQVKTVYTTGEIALTFGHFRQTRSDLVAFDMTSMSNHVGTEVSGVLGFAMLYMLDIKLDYRDNLVDFEYDPNRRH
jgi:tetratricopeptide (TPR) repeat protein